MSTILLIVLIILLLAALPTFFPYSMHDTPRQLAPSTRNRGVTSPDHDPFVSTRVETSRVHRTWSDRLKMWRSAYETKIWDSRRVVTGRGSSPEASREAAKSQWVEEHAGISLIDQSPH